MSSREKILQVALDQFYRKGYQATSVDDIIAQAVVSKSNFYYHFKSKEDLGLAVLEIRGSEFGKLLDQTLCNGDFSPRRRLRTFLEFLHHAQDANLKGGCPFGNLAAEMAEHSERFRCQISDMFGSLAQSVTALMEEGQAIGEFRNDIGAAEIATLIVQTVQGMLLLTKCHKSLDTLKQGAATLLKLIDAAPSRL
jgi:TetR/AcrR family transcriptional regulator, transcriptional repressor for nem operon